MMEQGNKTPIVAIVSVIFLGIAGYFVYRGIRLSSDSKKKLKELEENRKKKKGDKTDSTKDEPSITIGDNTQSSDVNIPTSTTSGTNNITPRTQSRLREKPSTSSKVLKIFSKRGVIMPIEETIQSGFFAWYKVTDPDTKLTGYIRSDQVKGV